MTIINPVIRGFYPDPSVCRVGDDYFLVTSSFEYFPGVPVFHSRDLVNWRQIGHCLTRKSQLAPDGQTASLGIYAPTLRHHNGRFYMTTTNTGCGKHLIVWADDPAGEWSEPVWIADHGYMDPSLLFDDDGRVYFTSFGNFGQGLIQTEIDVHTGARLSETRLVWPGTGGASAEGPHLYKIDGLYYLLLAEGGTEYGHMVTLARSATPWGPWEACPHNPILTNRSQPGDIQCIGHGDLVQDHRGAWWMVCLGVRTIGYPHAHTLGRETFLAPVRWEDGWPLAGDTSQSRHGKVLPVMEAALPPAHPWPPAEARDDFDRPDLDLAWNVLRYPDPGTWSLTERPGFLRLHGLAVGLDDHGSPAWVGRRQRDHCCTVTARLEFAPRCREEEAGLCAMMNASHHYEVALRGDGAGGREAVVRRRIGSLVAEVLQVPLPAAGAVELQIAATPGDYGFRFRGDGQAWSEWVKGEARYLSKEVAGGFTGVYFGLYATGHGSPCSGPADFDWCEYVTQKEHIT